MKKLLLSLVLVFAIAALSIFSTYAVRRDQMAARRARVDHAWIKVSSAMQRRADLVPSVLATMRATTARNRSAAVDVEQARADLQASPTPAAAISASRRLEISVSRLYSEAQNDPDLPANHRFFTLEERWVMATNRIAPERARFDAAVRDYNAFLSDFPNNIFARWASYTPLENYFTLSSQAEERPFGSI